MRLPSRSGRDWSRGLRAGISLLFSSMGIWPSVNRRRWLTAESSCSGLPSLRPLPRNTLPSTARRDRDRNLLLQEPGAEDLLKERGVQLADHPEEGRVTRRRVAACFIAPAAQGPQLALGQLAAQVFKALIAARAHQRRHRRAGQHKGLPVPQTVAAAPVGQHFKSIQQRLQLPARATDRARPPSPRTGPVPWAAARAATAPAPWDAVPASKVVWAARVPGKNPDWTARILPSSPTASKPQAL